MSNSRLITDIVLITILVISVFGVGYYFIQNKGVGYILGEYTGNLEFSDSTKVSTWVWKSPDDFSEAELNNLVDQASSNKIKTIFLDISKYIDLYEEEEPQDREIKLRNFENALKNFIEKSDQSAISVHATSGNVNWANDSHEYIPLLILDFVKDFNQRNPYTSIKGVQFDIEFYNQENYAINRQIYTTAFLSLSSKLVDKHLNSGSDMPLGFAIPFWFDDEYGNNIFNELANTLNRLPNSYLAIMAYRNYQTGSDGAISLVEGEFAYVQENTPNVKLIIAQETGDKDIPKTSFHGKSRFELYKGIDVLVNEFSSSNNFGGIAIHDFDSFLQLKK